MNTLVLNAETAKLSVEHLLKRANEGGIEVQDGNGNLLAFVLSPNDREALTYAEANFDLNQNIDQVRKALGRRGGITTAELISKAVQAVEKASRQ